MIWQTSASLRGNCLSHHANPAFLHAVVQNTEVALLRAGNTLSQENSSQFAPNAHLLLPTTSWLAFHFKITFKPPGVLLCSVVPMHTSLCDLVWKTSLADDKYPKFERVSVDLSCCYINIVTSAKHSELTWFLKLALKFGLLNQWF